MSTTTHAPPAMATGRFTEQLHILVEPRTRSYVLGRAILEARTVGPNVSPKEGESARELIMAAIAKIWEEEPEAYAEAVALGAAELERRAELKRERAAARA